MKSTTGKLLSIAFWLFIVGCITCIGAAVSGARTNIVWNNFRINAHFDDFFNGYDSKNYDSEEYTSVDEDLKAFDSINIQVDALEVRLQQGDNYRLQASYLYEDKLDYEVKDGKLIIKQIKQSYLIGIGKKQGILVVTVPKEKQLKSAKLAVGIGEVNIDGLYTDKLNINGGVGELTGIDIISNETTIYVGVGEVTIQGELKGQVTVEGGVGETNIETSIKEKNYNYDISQGVGEVLINNKKFGMFDDACQNNGAENNMRVKGGIGKIVIKTE